MPLLTAIETGQSDFIISAFRNKLHLWFEINDHPFKLRYINEAQLYDGSSYLWMWFESDASYAETLAHFYVNDKRIGVTAILREDSIRTISRDVLKDLALAAISDCQSISEETARAGLVCLLAFEVRQRVNNSTVKWLNLLARELNATPQICPPYTGASASQPGWESIEEPDITFAQLVLDQPTSEATVGRVLACYLENARRFKASTNESFKALHDLETQFGIVQVRILSRRF